MRSTEVMVTVDLARIRANAEQIRAKTRVPLIAVVKADAYGLGAPAVVEALADIADEFAFFSAGEARDVVSALGRPLPKPGLALGPPDASPEAFGELGVRPTVGTLDQARTYRGLRAAIDLDTGMQRFGCRPEELRDLLAAADTAEVLTHAAALKSVEQLAAACLGLSVRRHAASTSLLDEPTAWLEGVRPGLALYRGALRVTTRLMLVRATTGPIGYTGFDGGQIGVLPAGYAAGVAAGTAVLIGGRRQRVLEAGMNTSFVSVDAADRAGDEAVLVGAGLDEFEQAAALNIRPQEVLCRFAGMGQRIRSA